MRVLATFGVVFLHTAAPVLHMYHKIPEAYWWIANIYDSMLRMCVPLFFMISGVLLLQKQESLRTFFLKRVNKVLIPLLAWSMFFVLWNVYYEHSASLSFYSLYSLLYAPAYYHLWFLYALIGVYVSVPLLRIIVQQSNNTLLYYGVGLWFLAASLVQLIENFTGVTVGFDLRFMSGYAGYLLLGWLLGKQSFTSKQAIGACALAFMCVLITAVGTYFLTIGNGGIYTGYFYGPLAPNVILLAGSVFVLIKYLVENYSIAKDERVLFMLRSVSSASFGIFLIHTVFLYLLRHGHLGIYLYGWRGNPLYHIPVVATAAFCLSYGTIYLLRINHLTRRFVP